MISEDDLERGEKEIQDLTNSFIEQMENIATEKEKDIMEV
jgi:ribosome recycling factor